MSVYGKAIFIQKIFQTKLNENISEEPHAQHAPQLFKRKRLLEEERISALNVKKNNIEIIKKLSFL